MSRLDEIEARLAAANVTVDRPWELYCDHDRMSHWDLSASLMQNHTVFGGHSDEDYGPCRLTTGEEFDEHVAADLFVNAVNDLAYLVALHRGEIGIEASPE